MTRLVLAETITPPPVSATPKKLCPAPYKAVPQSTFRPIGYAAPPEGQSLSAPVEGTEGLENVS